LIRPVNTNPIEKYSYSRESYRAVSHSVRPGIIPTIFARNPDYIEPLRCLIEIRDLADPSILKYSYDSFKAEHHGTGGNIIQIDTADVSVGVGNTGSFQFTILDNEKVIPRTDVRRNNVVIIKGKKYEGEPWTNLLYGFQKRLNPLRQDTGSLKYVLAGFGSGIVLSDRLVNYVELPKIAVDPVPGVGVTDPTMAANKLYRKLYESSRILMVSDGYTLKEHGKFDLGTDEHDDLIDSRVDDNLYGINEPIVEARQIHNRITETVGAEGGIDAYNRPFLRYPSTLHSGITLRAWDNAPEWINTDLAEQTAYFFGPFDYEMDWSKESGFANRLLSKSLSRQQMSTTSAPTEGAGSTTATNNFVDLLSRDLGVRFKIGAAKLQDIAIMIQRIGSGGQGSLTFEGARRTTTPNIVGNNLIQSALFGGATSVPVLHGHVVRDLDGFPVGNEIATFEIALEDIPTTPTPMFLTNLKIRATINPDDWAWILLYATSAFDPTDTVRWFHNGQRTGTNGYRAIMRDHNNSSGWTVRDLSFEFLYNIYDTFTYPLIAEDTDSQARFGLVEDIVDVSSFPSNSLAYKYMLEQLDQRCKPKIIYTAGSVSIPNGMMFEPGQIISIADSLSDLPLASAYWATIENVRYGFGTQGTSLGCKFADITPLGQYDFKADEGFN
jgi:hypothetical protein